MTDKIDPVYLIRNPGDKDTWQEVTKARFDRFAQEPGFGSRVLYAPPPFDYAKYLAEVDSLVDGIREPLAAAPPQADEREAREAFERLHLVLESSAKRYADGDHLYIDPRVEREWGFWKMAWNAAIAAKGEK
jgi:PAS domain-containing protein